MDILHVDFSNFMSFLFEQRPDQQRWSCALRRTLLHYYAILVYYDYIILQLCYILLYTYLRISFVVFV